MSTSTNTHIFVATDGSKSPCSVCGKTRNTKAHKQAQAELAAQVESDVAMEAEMDIEADLLGNETDEGTTVAEAREDMLPDASDAADDAEIADAMEAAGIKVADAEEASPALAEAVEQDDKPAPKKAKAAAKKAPAKKAAKPGEPTATIWVGWRITNAAVLQDTKVAAKLKAAKPTADLDRTVKLTKAELAELDGIAAKFMEPGHTGPEIYSGRALRGRIAAALAKIEEASK